MGIESGMSLQLQEHFHCPAVLRWGLLDTIFSASPRGKDAARLWAHSRVRLRQARANGTVVLDSSFTLSVEISHVCFAQTLLQMITQLSYLTCDILSLCSRFPFGCFPSIESTPALLLREM